MKFSVSCVKTIALSVKKSLVRYSPQILTGLGVSGLITSTILAVKATPKALELIKNEKEKNPVEDISKVEIVRTTWKLYIPACAISIVSIACVVGGSSINLRRNAILAAAYATTTDKFAKYKSSIAESIGDKAMKSFDDSRMQEEVNSKPVSETVKPSSDNDILFYDSWSGRYFYSDRNKINRSINELNSLLLKMDVVCLNDFYDAVGLERNKLGYEYGWNNDDKNLIDIKYSPVVAPSGEPCLAIDFFNQPTVGLFW